MANITVTNNGAYAVRFFDGENQVDIQAGESASVSVKSGALVLDLDGSIDATMQSYLAWQATGSLGG